MENTVESRIAQIEEELNIPKIKIGELAEVNNPSQSVNNWIKRNSIPPKAAKKLSENTGYSFQWIVDGIGNSKSDSNTIQPTRMKIKEWESMTEREKNGGDFVTVPVLDIELSAGNGSINSDEQEMYTIPFRSYTLKQHGIPCDKVKVVRVSGDSMEPRLFDRDTISINMADTRIRDGKIYAVRVYDSQKVKILIKNADGTVTLRSLNPAYKDEIISREQMENSEFQVLGRMWWHSSIDK